MEEHVDCWEAKATKIATKEKSLKTFLKDALRSKMELEEEVSGVCF